ncbi:hypothetical protein Natpe_4161 (plasmid) [Natrinema pellirubrum DSM 15624]|uniref:Uncharacterized protein n=1 Tax=Natrinema pellirubrum (strain DSM 15624 / CIP 106293 / JCM 10476 / NCIMB 786 / 157) TaxID=797303 RepID=G4GPL8_NATP1|nr:hypothetical protein Natpe_4161 [Natrinema pellirubrum DSM 15624]
MSTSEGDKHQYSSAEESTQQPIDGDRELDADHHEADTHSSLVKRETA